MSSTVKRIAVSGDRIVPPIIADMLTNDIGRLPVVDRHDRRHLLGYLGRAGIMRARVRLFQEENLRERGIES